MNLEERLKKAQAKLQEHVNKLNELENQKQEIIKETLRWDGAVRELNSQIAEEKEVKSNVTGQS